MECSEGHFEGVGGVSLFCRRWLPEGRPKAALAIIHGFGEHCGRYTHVVDCLVPLGYAVHSFDLRGHGRSPGKRGHISCWDEFRGDVDAFLKLVRQEDPNLPLFLMGHSMGGLIVLEYALRQPEGVRGVIASGPLLVQAGVSPILISVSRVLSRVLPGMGINVGLDASSISRDPEVVRAYREDPLVHGLGTPRLATELAAAQKWTMAHASQWTLPLLVIHGGADRLVPPSCSQLFFEQAPVTDKQRIECEGGYHEPHNDIIHEQVTAGLQYWLARHLA